VPVASRANTTLAIWSRHEDIPPGAECLTAKGAFELSIELRKVCVLLQLRGADAPGAIVLGWTNNKDDSVAYEHVRSLARQRSISIAQTVEVAPDLIAFLNFGETTTAPVSVDIAPAAESGEAIDMLSELIKQAAEERATDIHLLIDNDRCAVHFRIGHPLIERKTLRRDLGVQIARAMHSMSGGHDSVAFNTSNPKCENAKLEMTVRNNGQPPYRQEIRWASAPTTGNNFDIVLRLLGSTISAETFTQLGFDVEQDAVMQSWMEKRSGLIAICGTTSSGKSTTLKTSCEMILRIREGEALHTIESPVEYRIKGARQREVSEANTFSHLLRQEMRLNPNILMVGEVRDDETAKSMAQAVTTGHLVLTTLHTSDQFALVERLGGLGIDATTVSDKGFIAGLIHQARVPLLCRTCSVSAAERIPEAKLKRLEHIIGTLDGVKVAGHDPDCPECHGRETGRSTIVASLIAPDIEMLGHFRTRDLNLARLYAWSGKQVCDIVPGSNVLSRTTQSHAIMKMRQGLISPLSYGALETELTTGEAAALYARLRSR
jgi:type II secretory ATPase GspE/PulE/Tfp pilus assembly ATPase PilB-like protein